MTKRESIIEKIKALLAKTVENGCTEAEMIAALARAQALQDAYVVTAEELQLAKDEAAVLGDSMPDPNDPHNIRWHLSWVVEKFCVWRSAPTNPAKLPQPLLPYAGRSIAPGSTCMPSRSVFNPRRNTTATSPTSKCGGEPRVSVTTTVIGSL
jgi:hypothetical protein